MYATGHVRFRQSKYGGVRLIYIGNGFSVAMLREDAIIEIKTITKKEFLEAGKSAYSIIGHPEIADLFKLRLNRETVTLTEGDVLYVVTPSKRPKAGELVENGAKYQFIPESEGYAYKEIIVCLETRYHDEYCEGCVGLL